MNICVSGPDAVGKSTYIEKCAKKFNLNVIHSTAKTSNTLEYHLNLLDTHDNTCFDRFSVGERIFPFMYGREPKLTDEEFIETLQRVKDNNDMYVLFVCSNPDILNERLIQRGELDCLKETEEQLTRYNQIRLEMEKFFGDYKNFFVCDVAIPGEYDRLDAWTEENFGKKTVNVAYRQLCKDLVEKGHLIDSQNVRGSAIELCNYLFTVDDLESEYVSLKTGKSDLTYLAAEILWYWSARNDTNFIGKFASLWGRLSDDGVTNNSAYGYLLQKKHGFNQIEKIIELLKFDPNSRRAVMNINVPNERVIETKDEPCTISLTYQIRENKLHCTAVMRSNDVRFGLRNDFGYFIALQKYIAKRLGLAAGTYTHFAESIHFYSVDTRFTKDVAYGTMESTKEKLNIDLLLENKDIFINWVDTSFTGKEDFTRLLKEYEVIY